MAAPSAVTAACAQAWAYVVLNFPYSERTLFVVGTMLALTGTSLLYNAVLAIIYATNSCERYKIQTARWPDRDLVVQCLIRTHLVGGVLLRPVLLWYAYPLVLRCGMDGGLVLPSPVTVAWQLAVSAVLCNAMFYWAHRALHHRSIYKYIHKRHHEFKATVGIAAEHAHPVEQLLANAIPTFAGPLVCGMHFTTLWLWLVIRECETLDAHCGYDFPWSPFSLFGWQGGADRHDFHHRCWNRGNYGGAFSHFWDWLCGTDRDYWAFKQGKLKVPGFEDDSEPTAGAGKPTRLQQ